MNHHAHAHGHRTDPVRPAASPRRRRRWRGLTLVELLVVVLVLAVLAAVAVPATGALIDRSRDRTAAAELEGFARVAWAQAALAEAGVPTPEQVEGALGADVAAVSATGPAGAAALADGEGYSVVVDAPSTASAEVSYHAVGGAALALARNHADHRCVWNVSTDTRSVSGFAPAGSASEIVDGVGAGDVCDAAHAVEVVDAAADGELSGGGATGATDAGGGATGAASGVAASGTSAGTGDGGAHLPDPADPGEVTVTGTDAETLTVSWDVAAEHDSWTTGQTATAAPGDGDPVTVAVDADATTATLTGLTPDTAYTVTVAADGPGGQTTSSVTTATATANLDDIAVTEESVDVDEVTVSWGDAGVWAEQYTVSLDPAEDGPQTVDADAPREATFTGLTSGTDYTVTVEAAGYGGVTTASTTTTTAYAAPLAADAAAAVVNGPTTITVTWEHGGEGSDDVPPVDTYLVAVDPADGDGEVTVDGTETSATVTGLDAATTYTAEVTAVGPGGASAATATEAVTTEVGTSMLYDHGAGEEHWEVEGVQATYDVEFESDHVFLKAGPSSGNDTAAIQTTKTVGELTGQPLDAYSEVVVHNSRHGYDNRFSGGSRSYQRLQLRAVSPDGDSSGLTPIDEEVREDSPTQVMGTWSSPRDVRFDLSEVDGDAHLRWRVINHVSFSSNYNESRVYEVRLIP